MWGELSDAGAAVAGGANVESVDGRKGARGPQLRLHVGAPGWLVASAFRLIQLSRESYLIMICKMAWAK